jgi:hypothetical protein
LVYSTHSKAISYHFIADIGFQQGGANIHYLEKQLVEWKEKVIGLG